MWYLGAGELYVRPRTLRVQVQASKCGSRSENMLCKLKAALVEREVVPSDLDASISRPQWPLICLVVSAWLGLIMPTPLRCCKATSADLEYPERALTLAARLAQVEEGGLAEHQA